MKPIYIIVAVIVLIVLSSSVFVVNRGEHAVKLKWGEVMLSDFEPGLYFKAPIIHQVRKFDRRILNLDSQPERYLTSEKKDVSIDFFVKWKIKDAALFYTSTQGDELNAQQRLNPIVKEALRNEINSRNLKDVVSGERSGLIDRVRELSDKGAANLGISVVDVRIKRIDLPEDGNVLKSVFERMRTERKRVANQLLAEGSEASEQIRSNAERERTVLLAEANRDAQRLRGEGEAQAALTYATAYKKDPEFYAFYRSLEAYREAFAEGDGVIVVDPSSEFFKYFGEDAKR